MTTEFYTTDRLDSLDGLRGLAALAVVVFHILLVSDRFDLAFHSYQPHGTFTWLLTMTPLRIIWSGGEAVWLFFVLSGFVLSRRYWSGRGTPVVTYLKRRAVRLYLPVFASAIFAIVLLNAVGHLAHGANGLIDLHALDTDGGQILRNLTLLFYESSHLNGVWWSLRWEMWFSVLLPLVLAILPMVRCGPERRLGGGPLGLGLVSLMIVTVQPAVNFLMHPPTIVLQFMLYLPMFTMGVALAAYEPVLRSTTFVRNHRGRGLALLVVAIVAITSQVPLFKLDATDRLDHLVATCAAAGLMLSGSAILVTLPLLWPTMSRALLWKPIHWLGVRSFSLYLVHQPIVIGLATLFNLRSAPPWFFVLAIGVSLAVTSLFYRVVEAPTISLTSWIARRARQRQSAQLALVATSLNAPPTR